jgi:hypothetical protein
MLRTMLMLVLLAVPLVAGAENRDQLVKDYSDFAGSDANSRSLVDGLRDGKEVTLTDGKTTAKFTPATGKMGYGNVKIAISLAEANLAKQGITDPTPDQVKAEMTKILQERADGKGWGQIANSRGFKVGDLMRSDKASANAAARAERTAARADKLDRPEKPERPERPERPDRARGPR